MPITDNLRAWISSTHKLLVDEKRESGSRSIVNYLRFERPVALEPADEDAIWDAGWISVVSSIYRNVKTEGGNRLVHSVVDSEGRSFKQLQFVDLPAALSIYSQYASGARSYRIQERGWWEIVTRLRHMAVGATVADIFKSDEQWDSFWTAIKESDLWSDAA